MLLAMSRTTTPIALTKEQRQQLEATMRTRTAPARSVQRAKLIMLAAQGKPSTVIAREVGLSRAQVILWRQRFVTGGLEGLQDRPRPGKPHRYGGDTERRILTLLDTPPPDGWTTWTGGLVAKALGDVSAAQVWRVLRQHGIQLQRRHSWCVSTDPQFTQKAADIVGLYLNPPENALVISVDEKPAIQALERAQGWIRLPGGKALRGHGHEYKRHGTTTLFAGLEVHTGVVHTGHYRRRRRREFLDFMNGLVAVHPETELHVILDNLSTHKPKHDRWLASHPRIHFHYTPTHASWLNQVEIWFSILTMAVLRHLSATDPRQVRKAIDRFTQGRNEHPVPFEWTKKEVHQGPLRKLYSHLRN